MSIESKRYRGLQLWLPPVPGDSRCPGEYTADEAVQILTTLLAQASGRRFHSAVLEWEEELMIICTLCNTLLPVWMRYSMIPSILENLTIEDYQEWLDDSGKVVAKHADSLRSFMEHEAFLDEYSSIVQEGSQAVVHVPDVYGEPVEYTVKLPDWMREFSGD